MTVHFQKWSRATSLCSQTRSEDSVPNVDRMPICMVFMTLRKAIRYSVNIALFLLYDNNNLKIAHKITIVSV